MISAVVLAAGMSTRMGRSKQLLSIGEKTMIEVVIDKLLEVEIEEIIVVVGYQADKIKDLLVDRDIQVIYNSEYKLGQSTSLIKALEAINQKHTGILCMLGDQPLIDLSTLNCLINKFKEGEELIIFPKYNDQRGNPVIFSTKLKKEMLRVSGDQGARSLIIKYREQSKAIEVDDQGVIFDIDTESDYQKLLEIVNK
ncbi:molybdenum cofactor cytidylyltransferase [Natroniella acetigena]|uniref:molybdenum cofactor cytidylyltransferase n=1 Tax=Natroniella acetigena TaxID=52004 RepID=UPI00200A408B|nr:molybdenum cofactor cytidylyltransferase [Natroniella acetigena]MCK8827291.1 molybdenum cofactor cytidylyltransferase [Natroniella acetigena]